MNVSSEFWPEEKKKLFQFLHQYLCFTITCWRRSALLTECTSAVMGVKAELSPHRYVCASLAPFCMFKPRRRLETRRGPTHTGTAQRQTDGWMADARTRRLSVVFVLLRHDSGGCGGGRGGAVPALLTCARGSRRGHVVSLLCHTDAWNLSYAP